MTRRNHDDCLGEAQYEAWRSGLDPDRIDHDRVGQNCDIGGAQFAADEEIRALRREDRRRQEARDLEAEQERQYYEQLEQDRYTNEHADG
jgi:hypothetical protein